MKTLDIHSPKIDARHPHYEERLPDWERISDCIEGQRKIKEQGIKYLPRPGATSESDDPERYNSYKQRSVFVNFVGETQKNSVGQCFAIPPVFSGPEDLEPYLSSIDGAGVTAEQQSKCALGMVLAFSRAGIFTDYPVTSGVTSRADVESGNIAPKSILYDPRQIINWDTIQRGARTLLSFVMIEEPYVDEDDGYKKEFALQWRELRLEDDLTYVVRIWRQGDEGFFVFSEAYPTDSAGLYFDEIPFDFIGAETNNSLVEKPLLLDIADLTIAHYVDSADDQESVHITGQATPWASGLSAGWIENQMKGKLTLGSRAVIPLPEGGSVGLLQASPNTMTKESMKHKEELIVKLGAKIVEKQEVVQTATEKTLTEASRSSILSGVCSNVSQAYARSLSWATRFMGIENSGQGYENGASYSLNTEFAVNRISSEERAANREDYNTGLIDFEEARDNLKSGGVAYKEDEDVKDYHEEKADADFMKAQEAFAQQSNNQVEE